MSSLETMLISTPNLKYVNSNYFNRIIIVHVDTGAIPFIFCDMLSVLIDYGALSFQTWKSDGDPY